MTNYGASIQLTDKMTPILNNILDALNMTVSGVYSMQSAVSASIDTSSFDAVRDCVVGLDELRESAKEPIKAPESSPPEPQTYTWSSGNFEVFTNTGADRFVSESQAALNMMNQLTAKQNEISAKAANTDIFPPNAVSDINSIGDRMNAIKTKIGQIESNPMNPLDPSASSALENLRQQLSQALDYQNQMNAAVEKMDVERANALYRQLDSVVNQTEQSLRDNVNQQGRFNNSVKEGISNASSLENTLGKIVSAFGLYKIGSWIKQGANEIIGLSDEQTQINARINLMNDGLQTTAELNNMIFAAAQDSRKPYQDMASVVARFGNNAKDAFDSSAEVVSFAELIGKQMTIAGAGTAEANSAMLQLSQALGSGVLRGDELNSVFENAPNIIRNIADYLGVGIGKIRDMASEGEITADIVKNSIFAAADDINSKFEAIPMTWAQVITKAKNNIIKIFEPVLNKINELANNERFLNAFNFIQNGFAAIGNTASWVIDLIANGVIWISENWSWLSPIFMGAAAALGVLAAAFVIMKIQAMLANISMSPVLLIIIAIIGVIAVVIALVKKLSGTSASALGVITGGINIVIQFVKNLGITIGNIIEGAINAVTAACSNIGTAFFNVIANVKGWWYGLLSDVLNVISGIAEALNTLPFVEFDYSGIVNKADEYAAKSAKAYNSKEEYASVADAFNKGFNTYDGGFKDGWVADAFNNGAAKGDKWTNKIKDKFTVDLNNTENYAAQTAANTASAAKDTSDIKDSVSDTSDDELEYLRMIAERETVNKFTTAEIKLDFTSNATINSNMDIDGLINTFTTELEESLVTTAEGLET